MKTYAKMYACLFFISLFACAGQVLAKEDSIKHGATTAVNLDKSKIKEGMVLIMFGTSYANAKKSLDAIEKDYRKKYAEKGPVVVAYTSEKIREKLKKRGESVFSIDEALHFLAAKDVTQVTMQSFHITPAAEYNETERLIVKHLIQHPEHFTKAKLGAPLLVSGQDMHKVVDAVLKAIPQERTAKDAVIFMGHGNHHGPGDLVLQATATALNAKDAHVFLASVEGALQFDVVLQQLKNSAIKRVWLMPFMLVAGDHAVNDLMGAEADSWASRLRKAGFEVQGHMLGLGQIQAIRDIFLEHTKNARLELTKIRQAQ